MYRCDMKSMEDKIKTFSKFGDAGHGGITRYALSEEDKMARAEWLRRMEAIGATIEMDDLANMYATLPGSEPGLKRIVMGSHCDSVKNGGNYDGILGVMNGLAADMQSAVPSNFAFDAGGTIRSASGGMNSGGASFGTLITIQQMIVRSEDDIRRISQELYNLMQVGSRAQGRIITA